MGDSKRTADRVVVRFEVDEVGNIVTKEQVFGLTSLESGTPISAIPFLAVIPEHGIYFDALFKPDTTCQDRVKVAWHDEEGIDRDPTSAPHDNEKRRQGCFLLKLARPLQPGSNEKVDYGFQNIAANVAELSSWERRERKRFRQRKQDYGYVRKYISYAISHLTIEIRRPKELINCIPTLRCSRHHLYPNFPFTFNISEINNLRNKSDDHDNDHDNDLSSDPSINSFFDFHTNTWKFEIPHPVAGCFYDLRWDIPNYTADDRTIEITEDYQSALLGFGQRIATRQKITSDLASVDLFKALAQSLYAKFKGTSPENFVVVLMAYDRSDLTLKPLIGEFFNMEPSTLPNIPLGAGVSGAAFARRKVVAWSHNQDDKILIRPIPIPGINARYMISFPIYYQMQTGKDKGNFDLRPGATIGVVTIATNSASSRIFECLADSTTAEEAQFIAQGIVIEMIKTQLT